MGKYLIILAVLGMHLHAQTLVVEKTDGTEYHYTMADVQEIAFEGLVKIAQNPEMLARLEKMLCVVYPNPADRMVTIQYDLADHGPVSITAVNLNNVVVRKIFAGEMAAGKQSAVWDGRDASGSLVPPGSYIIRIRFRDGKEINKLVIIQKGI